MKNENTKSRAVEFTGASRIHMGFAVRDLDASLAFYETLLGAPPVKVRPGYAKFEPTEPSLNLAIHTSSRLVSEPVAAPTDTHYGVQVKSTEAVDLAQKRLHEAGYETKVEREATCCFAVQDKVWVHDPDGNEWEVFVVLDADGPVMHDAETSGAESACCDDTCCTDLEQVENARAGASTQAPCC